MDRSCLVLLQTFDFYVFHIISVFHKSLLLPLMLTHRRPKIAFPGLHLLSTSKLFSYRRYLGAYYMPGTVLGT